MTTNQTIDGELRAKVISTLKEIKRQIVEDSGRESYFATIDGVPRGLLEQISTLLYRVMCKPLDNELRALLDTPAYPNRLCHIDYTAHPYVCGCLKGDEEAQRRFDEHQGKVAQHQGDTVPVSAHWSDWSMVTLEIEGRHRTYVECGKPQGEPVAMSREQFESWVLGRAHPTYGWLDKHWLDRGDNPYIYADPYVQGLWVGSRALYAEQPAPVAVGLPVDPERERLMEIVQQYPNVDPLKYDAAVRTLRK